MGSSHFFREIRWAEVLTIALTTNSMFGDEPVPLAAGETPDSVESSNGGNFDESIWISVSDELDTFSTDAGMPAELTVTERTAFSRFRDRWFQPGSWEVDFGLRVGDRSGDLQEDMQSVWNLPSPTVKDRFRGKTGFDLSLARFLGTSGQNQYGWGVDVSHLQTEQTAVTTISSRSTVFYGGSPSIVGSVIEYSESNHREYTASINRISVQRIYRQSLRRGQRDWQFGLVGVRNEDSIRFWYTNESPRSGGLLVSDIQSPSESSSINSQANNLMLGPEVGVLQRWLFWDRLEFGVNLRAAALYNQATFDGSPGLYKFPFAAVTTINPNLIPPSITPTSNSLSPFGDSSRSTFHEFAPMWNAGFFAALHLTDYASVNVGLQQSSYYGQHTQLSGEDTTNTEIVSATLGLTATF